jgi:glycyl-tRNA synthetase beta chain
MARDLIFEIGTEEMPAEDMDFVRKSFKDKAINSLSDNRLHFSECQVYSTPRRLTLYVEGLVERQDDKKESVRGPAAEIAFDDEENPTKAGSGFARGQGVDVEDLVIRDDYVYVDKVEEGRSTEDLLQELLPKMLKKINFNKSMRWGRVDFRFVRPIKWILTLYGQQTINFSIAGVESTNYSKGHRFLGREEIKIANSDQYFNELEKNFVITNQQRRRDLILYQIGKLEDELGEVLVLDKLLSEVVDLVEYPTALCGSFAQEFLDLPDDVLITSMVKNQRYIPVKDSAC